MHGLPRYIVQIAQETAPISSSSQKPALLKLDQIGRFDRLNRKLNQKPIKLYEKNQKNKKLVKPDFRWFDQELDKPNFLFFIFFLDFLSIFFFFFNFFSFFLHLSYRRRHLQILSPTLFSPSIPSQHFVLQQPLTYQILEYSLHPKIRFFLI